MIMQTDFNLLLAAFMIFVALLMRAGRVDYKVAFAGSAVVILGGVIFARIIIGSPGFQNFLVMIGGG